jgi:hypothetical protein
MITPIRGQIMVIATLLVISATALTSPAQGGWSYKITPPLAGPAFEVGYFNSEYGCKDWEGSAIFLHPSTCHNHPSDYNCRIIGNGYAYPIHWPFPTDAITFGSCINGSHPTSKNRYWFFWYDSHGGTMEGGTNGAGRCEAMRQKYLHSNRPGEAGSGCFFVGNTLE